MSQADYLSLPEEKPYLEYFDGAVRQKPMPNQAHRQIIRFLDYLFHGYVMRHGGDAGPEGSVRLPDGSGFLLPDTAYWAPGRFSGDDSVPSVVVEVRSPEQSLADLRRKCRVFRANGVDVCWLIDPAARTVEIFEGESQAGRTAKSGTLKPAIMPGFSLSLEDLFAILNS